MIAKPHDEQTDDSWKLVLFVRSLRQLTSEERAQQSATDACNLGLMLPACAAWSVSSHAYDEFHQKFSIIQALFAEVYSRKARWWPSGDGMAYVS